VSARVRVIVCPCGWSGRIAHAPIILCPRCGSSDWRSETNAETLKRLRAVAALRGKCFTCRLRDVRPGARYCDECIKRSDDYQAKIAYKKCQRCGVDVSDRETMLCADCTGKHTDWCRQKRDGRIADGLCGRCGLRPFEPGFAQCVSCLDDCKDIQLARNRIAGMAPRDACSICTALGLSGMGHNRRTHDRWMERRKAWAP
jgi:hypothetical protein